MKGWWAFFLPLLVAAESIGEKKSSLVNKNTSKHIEVSTINEKLHIIQNRLLAAYRSAKDLNQEQVSEATYHTILSEINRLKSEKHLLEETWREAAVQEGIQSSEPYSLWDQEEITLAQLVMEYGSSDYLYIIPPELSSLKLHLYSNIPIPRQSWGDLLEVILYHQGYGLKRLNTYAKQIYLLKQDLGMLESVAYRMEQLAVLPKGCRICYLLTPPAEQVKSVAQFFEKFSDNKQTFTHQLGNKIAIVGKKEEIEKLLDFYDKVWGTYEGKISRVIPISKIPAKEMEKILTTFFSETLDKGRSSFSKIEQDGLGIFSLNHNNSLIVIGPKESVERAQKIIKETEDQLIDPAEMTIHIYTCRHSDPSDLIQILEKVYQSLLTVHQDFAVKEPLMSPPQAASIPSEEPPVPQPLTVSPPAFKIPAQLPIPEKGQSSHFLADLKTGTILMTVRRDSLDKIKELLKKLDIPKKMVEIEVLLFERKINSQNNFGMNLLKLGEPAIGATYTSQYGPKSKEDSACKGVLQFFFQGEGHGYVPRFDIAYNFLMSQDDIQLNAAPSVTTINQTPAKISIVEELSINNGATPIDTNRGTAFEKSFARAQYGITIVITPTIHIPLDNEDKGSITLQTNITFDTTKSNLEERPLVDRRNIQNEIRVKDGETIILGGLRRKSKLDHEEKIPFLGHLPGFGKLFGTTRLTDQDTEMFFFITPKIIYDSEEECAKIQIENAKKRPGDIPEFLSRIDEARKKEKKRFFNQSMKTFFTHVR